jgi:hypothetical protein
VILQHNSAEEALRPIFARWNEQDIDRPKVFRAVLDAYGEDAFWRAVPPKSKARVMFHLEKTGWHRPGAMKPVVTDMDKAISFFQKGAWSRLTDEQKALIAKVYA